MSRLGSGQSTKGSRQEEPWKAEQERRVPVGIGSIFRPPHWFEPAQRPLMAKSNRPSSRRSRSRNRGPRKKDAVLVFTRRNYQLMVLGLVMITVGYVIMRWENEVDGFISLYIAPVILLAGYLEIIYAIMWRPATDRTKHESEAAQS